MIGKNGEIKYRMLLFLCRAVGYLPTWFLYHVLLDIIFFVLYRVVRYRVKVVRDNLSKCFPEKTPEQIREIERKYYWNLSEIFVDTIDLVSITQKELEKRIVFENAGQVEAETQGRAWIAALAHYGSWEYFSAYQLFSEKQVVGVYRPLHDKAFDRLYIYSRSRFGLEPVAAHDLLRYYIGHRNDERKPAIGMISDPSPPRFEMPHYFNFLGRKTAFFKGLGTMAHKFKLPVYFMHVEKPARIRYRVSFEMIYDGKEEITDIEIMRRYVLRLEGMVRKRPELWMWSHRRWKHDSRFDDKAVMKKREETLSV